MIELHIWAACIGIGLGFITGGVNGLFCAADCQPGGYASWQRRLLRFAHLCFFGFAFINFAYANALCMLDRESPVLLSMLFIAGAVLIPFVFYLAAWLVRQRLGQRQLERNAS